MSFSVLFELLTSFARSMGCFAVLFFLFCVMVVEPLCIDGICFVLFNLLLGFRVLAFYILIDLRVFICYPSCCVQVPFFFIVVVFFILVMFCYIFVVVICWCGVFFFIGGNGRLGNLLKAVLCAVISVSFVGWGVFSFVLTVFWVVCQVMLVCFSSLRMVLFRSVVEIYVVGAGM